MHQSLIYKISPFYSFSSLKRLSLTTIIEQSIGDISGGIMLAKHRNYLLKDTKKLHAHVQVIPTGLLEIEIIEKKQHHAAEFLELHFEQEGKITKLFGKNTANGKPTLWQVPFNHDDAKDLENLIDEANEEFEILMRDL